MAKEAKKISLKKGKKIAYKTKKGFDTVKTFRKIKDQISREIADMNLEELQAYLKDKRVRL